MIGLLRTRTLPLVATLMTAFSLTACQAPTSTRHEAPAPPASSASQKVTQQVLGDGLYELVYSAETGALYVASAQGFKDVNGGVIYRINPSTLAVEGQTHTDLKNFGIVSDPQGQFIYVSNSLDAEVTKVDSRSGKVIARLALGGTKDKEGDRPGARELLLVGNDLYVGRVANPGFISVIDTRRFTLKTTISNTGKWMTGMLYSPVTQRVYAANGSGQILVINPKTHHVEARWHADDQKAYLFLNLAEDPATGRLFVTDNSQAKTTLVFDQHSGKVIKRLPGDALGIKFNAKRNEIYISQRESKKVLQLDASTYQVKQSWSFASNPNSLLVSPDGNTLYVSLKQEFNKDNSTQGPDSVARISLN